MKKHLFAILLMLSTSVFAQVEPVVTYDGGDLYFVPANLTSEKTAFMYSCRFDRDAGKTWFTIFDDDVQIVKQAEVEPEILNYQVRTVTSQRRFVIADEESGGSHFLDSVWTDVSDVTEDKMDLNQGAICFVIYDDNDNCHSRYMYISQTLFDDDDDFEFLRCHYDIVPLTCCMSDNPNPEDLTLERANFGGEECDDYQLELDIETGEWIVTMLRYKVYGGRQLTGTDIVSLDGTVKKTLGVTSIGTVVAINGNYYVTGYDCASSKYAIYKIAAASSSLSRVADISARTNDNTIYNLSGQRVKADTKGIVIRNGQKVYNE